MQELWVFEVLKAIRSYWQGMLCLLVEAILLFALGKP